MLNSYGKDPLGLTNYSFLEYCNLPSELKESIENEINFINLLTICITEESSVNWLLHAAKIEKRIDNRRYILKLAIDEACHFRLYLEILKKFFPNKNVEEEYNNRKLELNKSDFYSQFLSLDIDTILYNQFAGEALIFCEIKGHYLNTVNPSYKKAIKQILADETKHLSYSKKIQFNLSDSNKERFKKITILKIKKILQSKIGVFNYNEYYKIFKKHNLDITNFIDDMSKTTKSKDWIKNSLIELFDVDKNLKIIENITFEEYLEIHNIKDLYYQHYE